MRRRRPLHQSFLMMCVRAGSLTSMTVGGVDRLTDEMTDIAGALTPWEPDETSEDKHLFDG